MKKTTLLATIIFSLSVSTLSAYEGKTFFKSNNSTITAKRVQQTSHKLENMKKVKDQLAANCTQPGANTAFYHAHAKTYIETKLAQNKRKMAETSRKLR